MKWQGDTIKHTLIQCHILMNSQTTRPIEKFHNLVEHPALEHSTFRTWATPHWNEKSIWRSLWVFKNLRSLRDWFHLVTSIGVWVSIRWSVIVSSIIHGWSALSWTKIVIGPIAGIPRNICLSIIRVTQLRIRFQSSFHPRWGVSRHLVNFKWIEWSSIASALGQIGAWSFIKQFHITSTQESSSIEKWNCYTYFRTKDND